MLTKNKNLPQYFIAFAKPPYGCVLVNPYAQSPKVNNALQNLTGSYYFEKSLIRKAFKQNFGLKLPAAANITMAMALFDKTPVSESNYNGIRRAINFHFHTTVVKKGENFVKCPFYGHRKLSQKFNKISHTPVTKLLQASASSNFKILWTCSGLQLLSASWVCDQLLKSLHKRSNPKPALNRFMRDVKALMNQWADQSACPLKGLRVTATGRFSKRKKNMAQQISLSTGKVPLSTLKEKIDYSQGFVCTKLGTVGLKVWLCFR